MLELVPDKAVAELRAFSGGGGQVLFGTDVGYMNDFDTRREFRMMLQAGLDYRRILAALTTAPASRFGARQHTGCVHRGFDADLVVLGADPAEDVANFAKVRYTIRGGKIIYTAP